jgi:hypothetical protein
MLHFPTISFLFHSSIFGVKYIPIFFLVSCYSLFLRPKYSSQHLGSQTSPIHVLPKQQKTLSHKHTKQHVDLLTGLLTESVAELSLHCGVCKVTKLSRNCTCLPGREASCGSFNYLLQFLALSSPLLCLNITVTSITEKKHAVRILAVEVRIRTYNLTRKYIKSLSYERDAFLEPFSKRKRILH